MRLRHGAIAGAVILLVLLAVHVSDAAQRHEIAQLTATDIGAAAARAATVYLQSTDRCDRGLPEADLATMAAALIAVEMVATSRLERWLEAGIVRVVAVARVAPPDWSVGPAQIRISTARAASHWMAGAAAAADAPIGTTANFPAQELLEACGAHRHAMMVIKWLAARNAVAIDKLKRAGIVELAGHYNGQVSAPTGEAVIANYLYRELAYQVFQELRFRRVPRSRR